ncbi:MAG TPA: hypothetical protein VGM51_01805 [Armatimonadota bacterium]|jgi:hypothetical protein
MTPKIAGAERHDVLSSEKVMQTFRMPRELVTMLKDDAARRRIDLTALVVRVSHGYLTDFGLPHAAAALLDADREKLGMDREQYLLHMLYRRSQEVREKGAGFDAPGTDRKK